MVIVVVGGLRGCWVVTTLVGDTGGNHRICDAVLVSGVGPSGKLVTRCRNN